MPYKKSDYYHLRVNHPKEFSRIRTMHWVLAKRYGHIKTNLAKNALVRVGLSKKTGKWKVQSKLIPKTSGGKRWMKRHGYLK